MATSKWRSPPSKIRFSVGNLVLTSKLIDGTFPDYERVIPRHNDKMLEVDTKTFSPKRSTACPPFPSKRAVR